MRVKGGGGCTCWGHVRSECCFLLLLQGESLPDDLSWKGMEQWFRWGGAGGEVLLVFENAEDVQLHEDCAKVGDFRAVARCAVDEPARDVVRSGGSLRASSRA
jgi:hypothetical protein